ncbi:MAG: heparinase II/III domain-containing protein [Armatimonadota bacterium]
MSHHGLLLTDEDIQRLRDAEGKVGERRERVIASAEALLDEPVAEPDLDRPWGPYLTCAGQRMRAIQRCSLAYLLTGRDEFHARAKATVDAILAWESWIDPCHERPHQRFGLMTGIVCQALAHYLDWCADAVDEDELREIADHHRRKAVEPLLHDMELPKRFFRDGVNNWVAVMVGGAGLMALLLMDREPFYEQILERCAFHLRRYLTWVNDDGSTDEGGHYWAFGMEHALPLMEALRINAHRLPGALRWQSAHELSRIPALAKTAYFPLYCIQGDSYVVNFGDTRVESADRMEAPLRCLARMHEDTRVQWLADRLDSDSPLALIWHDPDLPAEPPTDLSPSRAFHGAGWAIVREDLESDDGLLLAVRAGHNAKTHSHRDLGTFILRAKGRGLIVDPGCPQYCDDYWIHGAFTYGRETIGHNCLLLDGEGQAAGADHRAEITRLEDLGNRRYMTVEVRSEPMGLELHRRAFEVALDEPATVKMADEVRLSRRATITWLLHYDPDAEAKMLDDSILIHNGPVTLRIAAAPSEPVSVRVETDHEVPFVAIETAEPMDYATLELNCTVEA